MKMTKAQVKKLLATIHFHPEILIAHRDGTFSAKWSFFYTFGKTSSLYADKIKTMHEEIRILEYYDDWNAWPKTSYFVVKFDFGGI